MKRSIAKRLTLQLALVLTIALAAVCLGGYLIISGIVSEETERYSQSVAGIYADMLVYGAEKDGVPLDVNYGEKAALFGDYICEWYRIDYLQVYLPRAEENGMEVIAMCRKGPEEGEGYRNGEVIPREFTPGERALIAAPETGMLVKRDRKNDTIDTLVSVDGPDGNRVMVCAGVSYSDAAARIAERFGRLARVMIPAFAVMLALMYLLVRRRVQLPARRIALGMSEYITDGARSAEKLDEGGDDEFAMISRAFNTMTENIDSYVGSIGKLTREQERSRAEVDIAARIQAGFLPEKHARLNGAELSAVMIPARDIGGDLYDYFPLDGHRTMLVIADVSGKGMAAAMFMAVTLILIRQNAKGNASPAAVLEAVNGTLAARNPNMMFATAFIAVHDSEAGTLTYCNAGHNAPYLLSDGIRPLDGARGALIGLFAGEKYTCETVPMRPGDTLFLYTDGVTEALNGGREFFGEERLKETLARPREGAEDAAERALNAVRSFLNGAEQHDDITILTMTAEKTEEVRVPPEPERFGEIRRAVFGLDLPRETAMALCVAAEEIFVNICSYAFEGRDKAGETVLFRAARGSRVTMTFTDHGVPFDPRQNVTDPDGYDIDTQVGGLGRLIAFTIADSVEYEYRDGNILTLTKTIKEDTVYDDHQN